MTTTSGARLFPGWASNFYPVKVTYEGIEYLSTEHAYQASKTLDMGQRRVIAGLPTAFDAKRQGRKLPLRPDWEQVKLRIMLDLLRLKFAQPWFRGMLIESRKEHAVLIEWNRHHDNEWGACLCDKCPGTGKNLLGRLLTGLRDKEIDPQ